MHANSWIPCFMTKDATAGHRFWIQAGPVPCRCPKLFEALLMYITEAAGTRVYSRA